MQDALGWIPKELKFLKLKELLPIPEDVQMAAQTASAPSRLNLIMKNFFF